MMFRYLTSFIRRCCTKFKAVYKQLLLLLTLMLLLKCLLISFYLVFSGELRYMRKVETPSANLAPPTTTARSSLSSLKQQRSSKNVNSSSMLHNVSAFSYAHARIIYIVELLCAVTVICCLLALLAFSSTSILPFRIKVKRELRSPKNSDNAGNSSKNPYSDSKELKIGGLSYLVTVTALDNNSVLMSMAQSPEDMNGQPTLRTCSSDWRRTGPFQTRSRNGKEATTPSVLTEHDELQARYCPCQAGDTRMKESYQSVKNKEALIHTQDLSLKTEIEQLHAIIGAKNAEVQNLASTVKTLASVRKAQSRDAEIRALNGIIETLLTNI